MIGRTCVARDPETGHLSEFRADGCACIRHAFGTSDRNTKAEFLFSAGRYEDAVRWYDSIAWLNQAESMYLGPSYRGLAQSYDELGQTEKAIEHYTRFIALWSDCDPEYVPLVDEARERLDVLLGSSSREPAATLPS
jgi:tetratricopeptide (TPR) repeat protein